MTKTVQEIRDIFLNYFAERGHEIVPSSPLVPHNDPTMMFVNSGMVQFKNIFTEAETRPYKRATTAQKCVRAGGKHNDLENVGYTARHHTFFEMLGNFSFGDYFKEQAIEYAWELVTQYYGLPAEKLLVTIYSEDEEAYQAWKKVAGLPDEKIIRISTSDNFWMMGDTGPCGPCSEIFYDHGPDVPGGQPGRPYEDGDLFIEIWNLVFMQYEQHEDGTRTSLPNPCIDTGMGLERIAAVLQGKHDNYEIDLLRAIIDHASELLQVEAKGDQHPSFKVIADHLRAAAFLMADGVMPSNEGRGYVLRRIMRRGMRHAYQLGAEEPLMYKLIPTLVAKMGEAYPELRRAEAMVSETLRLEEARFQKTLGRGLKLLEEETRNMQTGQNLAGEVAFKLYDTYGFPVDLTADALRARGLGIDMEGFEVAMERQKEAARAAWSGSGEQATEKIWFQVLERCGPTEFLGYERERSEACVQAILKDGQEVQEAGPGDNVLIITNQTPFYGESGGQMGDQGQVRSADGAAAQVTYTHKKLGQLIAHEARITEGTLRLQDTVDLAIDRDARSKIRAHHSVTHLMHEALRRVLGAHVAQKGSLQDSGRTRFDISHNNPLSQEEIIRVEDMVNAEIRADTQVETRVMAYDEAMETGAQALFGEKYGDEVRVVSMGTQPPGSNNPFSVELCGGTHVQRTGQIGLFKITGQSAVSAGVRRLEAVAGEPALLYIRREEDHLQRAAVALKSSASELPERVENLLAERKKLENDIANLRRQLASGGGSGGANDDVREISGIRFLARVLDDIPARDLKPMADEMKEKLGSGVIALIARSEGKASLVVGVTSDLTDRFSAVDLVRAGAEALGGKGGGGRPDMAQAGGPNADTADQAVQAIERQMAG